MFRIYYDHNYFGEVDNVLHKIYIEYNTFALQNQIYSDNPECLTLCKMSAMQICDINSEYTKSSKPDLCITGVTKSFDFFDLMKCFCFNPDLVLLVKNKKVTVDTKMISSFINLEYSFNDIVVKECDDYDLILVSVHVKYQNLINMLLKSSKKISLKQLINAIRNYYIKDFYREQKPKKKSRAG